MSDGIQGVREADDQALEAIDRFGSGHGLSYMLEIFNGCYERLHRDARRAIAAASGGSDGESSTAGG